MFLDLESMSKNAVYHTLTQVVVPRPVAWVLSENADSGYNLAPFSYFSVVCSDPAVLMLSIGNKPDGSVKDTYLNITERQHFVVHIAGSEMAAEVTQSSAVLPEGESELNLCGLDTVPVEGFKLPRVAGPRIAMACELYQTQDIGRSQQHLVFGEIKSVWLDDAAVTEDAKGRMKVNTAAVDPLGRLGGSEYVTMGSVLDIPRP